MLINKKFFLNCFYVRYKIYTGFTILNIKSYDTNYLNFLKNFFKKNYFVLFFLKKNFFKKFFLNLKFSSNCFYLFYFNFFNFLNSCNILINNCVNNCLIRYFFLNNLFLKNFFLKNLKFFKNRINIFIFFLNFFKYFFLFFFFFLKKYYIIKFNY